MDIREFERWQEMTASSRIPHGANGIKKRILRQKKRLEGGRNMAWIIGTAIFLILFLTVMFVIAGIAVSVAGSYQTD